MLKFLLYYCRLVIYINYMPWVTFIAKIIPLHARKHARTHTHTHTYTHTHTHTHKTHKHTSTRKRTHIEKCMVIKLLFSKRVIHSITLTVTANAKEFCMGGSKAKTVLHYSYSMNSAIFFVYRTGYAYGKEPEGFQKVFLGPFNAE